MTLDEGIAQLGLTLPAEAITRLEVFLALLEKWNRVHNLTAHRTREAMIVHHLLDALAALPTLALRHGRGARIADVGSGAGVPGLVLAMARPDWRIVSIEARGKKVAFQRQAAIELKLANVEILGARVEQVDARCDAAISRAFSALDAYVRLAGHLAGRLWAMKGVYPAEEVARLPAPWRLESWRALSVPGMAAPRCLLELTKACTSSP
ncbi:MAG: 16S rRNA (guanine(527)-N(7))-methyltransferase RsmG [Rhodocyclaceae bacterium]|nr:16S rRNA (guanine(527)-N(7))-methyltransferase RsmG [Rhodocyclaceae bacterium]